AIAGSAIIRTTHYRRYSCPSAIPRPAHGIRAIHATALLIQWRELLEARCGRSRNTCVIGQVIANGSIRESIESHVVACIRSTVIACETLRTWEKSDVDIDAAKSNTTRNAIA